MNTTIISGRLVRNPGYNEVENEKGLHKNCQVCSGSQKKLFR